MATLESLWNQGVVLVTRIDWKDSLMEIEQEYKGGFEIRIYNERLSLKYSNVSFPMKVFVIGANENWQEFKNGNDP